VKPAVAVMARVPGAGPVKTRLHDALTPAVATELYRCFLLDRLEALAALPGIDPVVAFTPATARAEMAALAPSGVRLIAQTTGDLSERLITLVKDLLEDGHPAVLAMDSDSPTLPMHWVSEAADVLVRTDADVVLGPCDDGGYYLVGVRASHPELFSGIPWSSDAVLATTRARVHELGLRARLLGTWFDVDDEPALRRLHAELRDGATGAPRTRAFLAETSSMTSASESF
jgi:rSAM/selenodomain-associated transferase 1